MPPQFSVHALEGWFHEGEHVHVPDAPALAGEVANGVRAPLGVAEPPSIGPVRASQTTAVAPADGVRAASIAVPTFFAAPLPATPSLPLPALDSSTAVAQAHGAEAQAPARAELFLVGVPAPAPASVDGGALSAIRTTLSFAEPLGLPWLAGMLTPAARLDIGEPLFALESVVGAAQGWSRTLAHTLASLIASPWMR